MVYLSDFSAKKYIKKLKRNKFENGEASAENS